MKEFDDWVGMAHRAKRKSWYEEMEDDDIYFNEEFRDELVDDDEMSAAEAGFLRGCEDA